MLFLISEVTFSKCDVEVKILDIDALNFLRGVMKEAIYSIAIQPSLNKEGGTVNQESYPLKFTSDVRKSSKSAVVQSCSMTAENSRYIVFGT